MKLSAFLLALIIAWRSCHHDDDVVPLGIACAVAVIALAIVQRQLSSQRQLSACWPVRRWLGGEVANDNAGRQA